MKTTLDIRGEKLRTQTQRRYIVVVTNPPVIVKRTDDIWTARKTRTRTYPLPNRPVVIVDTTTGEEVTR
jgi:hypothetical protein